MNILDGHVSLDDFFKKQAEKLDKIIKSIMSEVIEEVEIDDDETEYEIDYNRIESITEPLQDLGMSLSPEKISEFLDEHPDVDYTDIHNTGITVYLNESGIAKAKQKHDDGILDIEAHRNRIREINSHIASDMPECIRLFIALEESLQCQNGMFAEWMQVNYELFEGAEITPAEMAKEICGAFENVKKKYGEKIAYRLYNSQSAVLPDEIVNAAEYLHLGGQIEHIGDLCKNGLFMPIEYEELGYEEKKKAVEYMNNGGTSDEIFRVISEQDTEKSPGMDINMM